jgi:hypothetical protein
MIMCSKCNNETRTAALLSANGDIMVTGPAGSPPLPIAAQVCVACGHIDLYAPQSFEVNEHVQQEVVPEAAPESVPAV